MSILDEWDREAQANQATMDIASLTERLMLAEQETAKLWRTVRELHSGLIHHLMRSHDHGYAEALEIAGADEL